MTKAKYRIKNNGTSCYVTVPKTVLTLIGAMSLDGSLQCDCIRFKQSSQGVIIEPAFN